MNVSKLCGLGILSVGVAFGAVAETRTWTGGGDGASWNQEANWENAAKPQNGDAVVLSAATEGATLNNDIPGLTALSSITLTGANGFTVSGNALSLTDRASVLANPPSGKTFTIALPLALAAAGGTNVFLNGSAGAVKYTGVISGAGALYSAVSNSSAEVFFTAANTYAGGTYFETYGGKQYGDNAQAFGTGRAVTYHPRNSSSYLALSQKGPYEYDLTVRKGAGDSGRLWVMRAEQSNGVIWDGTISSPDTMTFQIVSDIATGNHNRSMRVKGAVDMPNTALQLGASYTAYYYFERPVRARTVEVNMFTGNSSGATRFLSGANEWSSIKVGYYGTVFCDAANALCPTSGVFATSDSAEWSNGTWKNGSYYLNGCDQTVAFVSGGNPKWKPGTESGAGYLTSSSKATLTINGTQDAACCFLVDGKLSLVYNAADAGFVQTFSNRTSSTTGSITVSNGTFRVGDAASFPNVPTIAVADGAVFDLQTAVDAALQGLTALTITGAGRFVIGDSTPDPFKAESVVLKMDEDARITVPAGMTLSVRELWIGGVPQTRNTTYSGIPQILGGGSIKTADVEIEIPPAVWTGKGDGTSWSQAANWEDGVRPQNGYRVVLSAAAEGATLNNDISGLTTLRSLTLTGANGFTVGGNALGLTDRASVLADPPSGKTYTIALPLELAAAGGTNAFLNTSVGVVKYTGVISGAGALLAAVSNATAEVHFSGANTYTGGTTLDIWPGKVYADSAAAFGAGTAAALGDVFVHPKNTDAKVYVTKASGSYFYNLRFLPGGTGADLAYRCNGAVWKGGAYCDDTFTFRVHGDSVNNNSFKVEGPLEMPQTALKLGATYQAYVRFAGALHVKTVTESEAIGSSYSGALHLMASGNAYEKLTLGGYGMVKCDAEQALCPAGGIAVSGSYTWDANGRWTNGSIYMNGHDQTVAYLSGGSWARAATSGHVYSGALQSESSAARGTEAATLTIRGTQDATSGHLLDDKTSLVYDATNSNYVQTFTRRAHLTTGWIAVSNGTVKVTDTATFQNLSAITVADGARFRLESTEEASLQKLADLTVDGSGRFEIADGVSNPFQPETLVLRLASAARIAIPEGLALSVKELWIGDELQEGGTTYSGIDQIVGGGSIATKERTVETVEATWNGQGADTRISTLENWTPEIGLADLTSGGLLPTFATGGKTATVDGLLKVKGLHFFVTKVPDGYGRAFTLVPADGTAQIVLNDRGVAADMSEDTADRHFTNAVPTVVKGAQTWTVTGAHTHLAMTAPLSAEAAYDITKTGAGELVLASDNTGLSGGWNVTEGTLTLNGTSNGLGRAFGTTRCSIGTGVKLRLGGCVEEKPLYVNYSYTPDSSFTVLAGTTNILSGSYENDGVDQTIGLQSGSLLQITGMFDQKKNIWLTGSGTLRISGAAKLGYIVADASTTLMLDSPSVGTWSQGAYRLVLKSGGRIVCARENQFNNDFHYLQFDGSKTGVFDLGGHDQYVGGFEIQSNSTGGSVYSETPATICLKTVAPTNSVVNFSGAVSCRMTGSGTMFFNRAVDTTGSLTVAAGTIGFTPNGSWRNGASFAVEGSGQIALEGSRNLNRRAVLSASGNGVFKLSSGVRQRCAELWIDGVKMPAGTYGATSAAEHVDTKHFAGAGIVDVGTPGILLLVR